MVGAKRKEEMQCEGSSKSMVIVQYVSLTYQFGLDCIQYLPCCLNCCEETGSAKRWRERGKEVRTRPFLCQKVWGKK